MRYAKSLKFMGILIDAVDATYTSYLDWRLVCPICGQPVFKVGGASRKPHMRKCPKSGKTVAVRGCEVAPAFSHFTTEGDCESIVRRIASAEKARAIFVARGQMRALFDKKFLSLLGWNKSKEGLFFAAAKEDAGKAFRNQVIARLQRDVRRDFRLTFLSEYPSVIEWARAEMGVLRGDLSLVRERLEVPVPEEFVTLFIEWLGGVNIDAHLIACDEAYLYLKSPSNAGLFDALLDLAHYRLCRRLRAAGKKVEMKSHFASENACQAYLNALSREIRESIIFADWFGD